MTIEEYTAIYSKPPYLAGGSKALAKHYITEGMLLFNEETACCWGGPFDGNYAYYVIKDFTTELDPPHHWLSGTIRLQANDKQFAKHIAKYGPKVPFEYATSEKPIQLYLCGNGDTSYSKFFRTLNEAVEEIKLLEACQALDMEKDIYLNDFVFTN